MYSNNNQSSQMSDLRRVIRMLEAFSLIGLLFSILAIAESGGDLIYIVSASWFAVALVSFQSILNFYKIGLYTLIIATVIVTVFDLTIGTATFGGASLAILLGIILYSVIKPVWTQFE